MRKKALDWYSVIYLLVSWGAIRFLLFGLHGMKQWPDMLAFAGAVAVALGLAFRLTGLSRCASVGYFVSFLIGYLLRRKGTDPGGGATDSLWIVWTVSYVVIILLGLLADLKRKKKR